MQIEAGSAGKQVRVMERLRRWDRLRWMELAFPLAVAFLLIQTESAPAAGVQLVSAHNPGVQQPKGGNGSSAEPILTPDGRFVLFTSSANNLVPGQNNLLRSDVYLFDRLSSNMSLVSVSLTNLGGGNGHSLADAVSTNGRYVLFESDASDLVANDTNGFTDVFERDLVAGTTMLISVATNGGSGSGRSFYPVMTPDGRYVAFLSTSSNLVAGYTNGCEGVFVRDTINGTTTLASVGAVTANDKSPYYSWATMMDTPAITPDGRYVAFFSFANGLTAGNTNYPADVYLRDLSQNTTTWVSSNMVHYGSSGYPGYESIYPVISDDDRCLFFLYAGPPSYPQFQIFRFDTSVQSITLVNPNGGYPTYGWNPMYGGFPAPQPDADAWAPRLTPDGRYAVYLSTNYNIHIWDSQTTNDVLVSVDQSGNPVSGESYCSTPVVSSDGRFVTFLSTATNLATNAIVSGTHIYQRDLLMGTTTLVDVDTNGFGSIDVTGTSLSVSSNGQYVAFSAPDGILVAGDSNQAFDVFLRDVVNNSTTMISTPANGVISPTANGISFLSLASLSTNGRWLVFASAAEDLATNDGNGAEDVFVEDLQAGTNALVSVATNGWAGTGGFSESPLISGDGRFVVFESGANLTTGVNDAVANIFKRDLQTGATTLVDVNSNGVPLSSADSSAPAMSQDGRYVTFLTRTNYLLATFWRDTVSNVTALVTNSSTLAPSITASGRYVAYSDASSHPLGFLDVRNG